MDFRSEYDKLLGKNASILTRLIMANVIVFLLVNIWLNLIDHNELDISGLLALPSNFIHTTPLSPYGNEAIQSLLTRPWTLITYMFLHISFMHILFNMLWLYWIGIIFVDFMGHKRLLHTYLLGGIAGGILYMLTAGISGEHSYLMGASAGIMAVIVATAILVPDYELHLLLLGPVKMKYLALGAFILTSLLNLNENTGGKISHIGGALYGYAYMYYYRKGTDISAPFVHFFDKVKTIFTFIFSRRKWKRFKGGNTRPSVKNSADRQKRIDDILDKISRSGYDALTKDEKDFLFKASNNKNV